MGMRNEFNFRGPNPVKIRSCKYLNNLVEQDHRRVKFRVSAMLGFKSFRNARAVLSGIKVDPEAKERTVWCSFQLWQKFARDLASCSHRPGATEPIQVISELRNETDRFPGRRSPRAYTAGTQRRGIVKGDKNPDHSRQFAS